MVGIGWLEEEEKNSNNQQQTKKKNSWENKLMKRASSLKPHQRVPAFVFPFCLLVSCLLELLFGCCKFIYCNLFLLLSEKHTPPNHPTTHTPTSYTDTSTLFTNPTIPNSITHHIYIKNYPFYYYLYKFQ